MNRSTMMYSWRESVYFTGTSRNTKMPHGENVVDGGLLYHKKDYKDGSVQLLEKEMQSLILLLLCQKASKYASVGDCSYLLLLSKHCNKAKTYLITFKLSKEC